MSALGTAELQDVLDAVLFEPGMWQAAHVKEPTACIPPPEGRLHLATPCGLLVNELVQSPMVLMLAAKDMVKYVCEFDEGKFSCSARLAKQTTEHRTS